MPARASAVLAASTGANPNSCGSSACTPRPATRASGARPIRPAADSVPSSTAEAPSLSGLALPGVIVPSCAEGRLEPGQLLRGRAGPDALVAVEVDALHADHQVVVEARRPTRRRPGCASGPRTRPGARGEIENRRWSCSLHSPSEAVHSWGIRSLTSRQPRVVETAVTLPAGKAREGLGSTHGARVIDSTPPATTTSASPVSIVREACIAASSDDPHSRLTVFAGTEVGRPASRTAIRPTLRLSSPAPLAQPQATSPISAGSSPSALPRRPVRAAAARSSGRLSASAPPKRPNGVRAAA